VLALVVYESFWGNTAAIAGAIAEGIDEAIGDARLLTTDAATADLVAAAGLVVAGAPVLGFRLPTEGMRTSLPRSEARAPHPPDVSHRSMRSWLEALPHGHGACAAFETRISWSPGGSVKAIEKALAAAGFEVLAPAGKFVVTGRYGPLRDGELERARRWGAELASRVPVAAG
jgi:flavorubredoxin